MTVKELIQKLSEYPENLPIVLKGYEGGIEDVSEIDKIQIMLNYNTQWWYGPHEKIASHNKDNNYKQVDALYLRYN